MDRKKKKQAAIKSAANVEQQRKALKARFLERSKEIITLMGAGVLLEKFNSLFLDKLYELRYPVLKAKAAPESEINKTKVVQFNKLLQQFMLDVEIPLANGIKIPIAWYLSEGMTLRDSIGELDTQGNSDLEEVKALFSYYSHEGEFHRQLQELLITLVTDVCTTLSDFDEYIYRSDLSMTPYFAEYNPDNDIMIHAFKPKKEKVETKKGMRNAIRLGWPSDEFKWLHKNVKPSLLGFNSNGLDVPLALYISTHTLDRLRERLNITPGIMHQILLLSFLEPKINHRWNGDNSHVEFRLAGEKVGYLVVELHGSILMIHTFLFLTNNGTQEGEKLGRLLSVVKEDKKYLEIDTLPAFNAYHIDQNEKLSKLFIEAGCGSLLKLGNLQEFTINQVADKDPESILHYLANAAYFRKQENNLVKRTAE
ncbi:hypothetical protein QG516_07675 [Pedobacter gandavensis]|uniref:hypothetical protein n=1 Tax=Pedobacter gandavensis TaxID=2679963 RepID=UPI00247A9A55|nr:hypothetical protein [Pedobacter gandavensis]WGQ11533.1 hypothetical protein QG516_07675 [Pedobacter gandavensis]